MIYQWVDINQYSRNFNISISTIRRRIKKGQFEIRSENGKYFIKVPSEQLSENGPFAQENDQLKIKVQLLQQEIQELKMLINIYEGRRPSGVEENTPPAIPQ